MRILFILVSLFSILSPLSPVARAQTPAGPPPPPSDFDSKAKVPLNLPATLDVPKNMRIEVKVWRKKPIHYPTPPDPNSMDIMMDPDLESATVERDQQNIHATFNWQGGRTSEAFVIGGYCFRKINFRYPDLVMASGPVLNFWLNRPGLDDIGHGDFPGITWYTPSTFVGTASVNGTSVLVFAQYPIKPGTDTLPDGNYVCLEPKTFLPLYMDDGIRVFTFTYTPDSNIQINPQGPYLKAIQKQFGHWP
jgi:hypothetical protein